MEKGLVTVVVPVYNTEKYLDRCVASIVEQTYENLEIILVDDGSPDGCPVMCDDWASKDSRVRVIHKKNAGLGMARNTGIEAAKGEYICFFDSDDYIDRETVKKAYGLAAEKKADVVVFGNFRVDKNGGICKRNIPLSREWYYSGKEVQEIFLPDLIDGKHEGAHNRNMLLSACNSLFSMKLIRDAQWRFVSEREIISEDTYSLIEFYRNVKSVAILPEAFYYHCENTASLTQVYRADRYERIRHFYLMTQKRAESLGYGEEVRRSVSGVFLSITIGALKQLVVSSVSFGQKRKMLRQIVNDDTMRVALKDVSGRRYDRGRSVLLWAIRSRSVLACYAMLMAKEVLR